MVGTYLLASDKAWAGAVPQLAGLAKALRRDASDDSLLLHLDATTGKVRKLTIPSSMQSDFPRFDSALSAGLWPSLLCWSEISQENSKGDDLRLQNAVSSCRARLESGLMRQRHHHHSAFCGTA